MKKPGGHSDAWCLSDDSADEVDGPRSRGRRGIPAFSREAFAIDLPREDLRIAEIVNFDLASIADFRAEETVKRRVVVPDDRCDWFHFFLRLALGYLQSRA